MTNNQATSDEPKMTNIDGVLTTTNPQGLEKCKTCSKLKSSQKNNSAKKTKIEECGDTKLNSKNGNYNFIECLKKKIWNTPQFFDFSQSSQFSIIVKRDWSCLFGKTL